MGIVVSRGSSVVAVPGRGLVYRGERSLTGVVTEPRSVQKANSYQFYSGAGGKKNPQPPFRDLIRQVAFTEQTVGNDQSLVATDQESRKDQDHLLCNRPFPKNMGPSVVSLRFKTFNCRIKVVRVERPLCRAWREPPGGVANLPSLTTESSSHHTSAKNSKTPLANSVTVTAVSKSARRVSSRQ